MVHEYLFMDQAIRTNDMDLFIYALEHMFPILDTHYSYNDRWMVLYPVVDPGGLTGLQQGPLFSNFNLLVQTEIHLQNPNFCY